MKKFSKLLSVLFIIVLLFGLTACDKKENDNTKKRRDYKGYIGYEFSGEDPWGNTFSINLKTLKDNQLTWSFNDVIGTGKNSITLSNEYTNEIKDGRVDFHVQGTSLDNKNLSYDYSGTIILKEEKVRVEFKDGQVTEANANGGSASYQVGALDEKTVVLTKTESK